MNSPVIKISKIFVEQCGDKKLLLFPFYKKSPHFETYEIQVGIYKVSDNINTLDKLIKANVSFNFITMRTKSNTKSVYHLMKHHSSLSY